MPIQILSCQEKQEYGKMPSNLEELLPEHFNVSEHLKSLCNRKKTEKNRLLFAAIYLSIEFLGYAIDSIKDIPTCVFLFLEKQLDIKESSIDTNDQINEKIFQRYRNEAIDILEFTSFNNKHPKKYQFLRFLYRKIWLTNESEIHVFYACLDWLRQEKILLPKVRNLERLVTKIRERSKQKTIDILYRRITQSQRSIFLAMLNGSTNEVSYFERLRQRPVQPSVRCLISALNRSKEIITKIVVTPNPFKGLSKKRIREIVRYVRKIPLHDMRRMPEKKQAAFLFAWYHDLIICAQEDALDILYHVLTNLPHRALGRFQKSQAKKIVAQQRAARILADAILSLLEHDSETLELANLFQLHSRQALEQATVVVKKAQTEQEEINLIALRTFYHVLQRFIHLLLPSLRLKGNQKGTQLLNALRWLAMSAAGESTCLFETPTDFIPSKWKSKIIKSDGSINRKEYTLCLALKLRVALARRNIFLESSTRWGDPYQSLIPLKYWNKKKSQYCKTLGLPTDFSKFYESLSRKVIDKFDQVEARFKSNQDISLRYDSKRKRNVLSLQPLNELEEPASLRELRTKVQMMLPQIDLPELLLEVDMDLKFSKEFTPLSGRGSKAQDIRQSIAAVLLAEACNIGIEPVANDLIPALTKERLKNVSSLYYNQDSLRNCNRRIVDNHASMSISKLWGNGTKASADGIRLQVPVKTVHAGFNRKYNARGMIAAFYNFVSDQYTGFHGKVISTFRDSFYVLDGIFENITSLQPHQLSTDTAGYSDIVFALFSLLGLKFCPRIASLNKLRLYKPCN